MGETAWEAGDKSAAWSTFSILKRIVMGETLRTA